MASRKLNEYLDAPDSQDELSDYDSDPAQDSRILSTAKRRKISSFHEADAFSDEEENSYDDLSDKRPHIAVKAPSKHSKNEKSPTTNGNHDPETHNHTPSQNTQDTTSRAPLSRAKSKSRHKTGVIYLSRIPPFMKPTKLRHLLTPYGPINRIFLTPEDATSRTTRIRHGGNKRRSYTDGWVEFLHKSDAKLVADTLNAKIIGGKKGDYYHDDVWNIRYLRGFKWADLTEQIKNENAERAARLRMEIAVTGRENRRFVENVERAKMLERMEGKRKSRGEKTRAMEESEQTETQRNRDEDAQDGKRDTAASRRSASNGASKAMPNESRQKKEKKQPEEVRKVLDMIL